MLTLKQVRWLRAQDGQDLVRRYAAQTAPRLSCKQGIPVVIAARNEADDLPATLLSLAHSSAPVHVTVAVNGTTDDTADRARAMGAEVLECPSPSKMAALQLAVAAISRRQLRGPILFTDADTLVGSAWVRTLANLTTADRFPLVSLGNALFTHGDSRVADMARNARKLALSRRARRHGTRLIAQGANLAIDFAGSERARASYLEIEPTRFIGEEEEIVARILAAGGGFRNALTREATVITRGDRFKLVDLWRLRRDHDFDLRRRVYEEYGKITPYEGQEVGVDGDPGCPTDAAAPGRTVRQSRIA